MFIPYIGIIKGNIVDWQETIFVYICPTSLNIEVSGKPSFHSSLGGIVGQTAVATPSSCHDLPAHIMSMAATEYMGASYL